MNKTNKLFLHPVAEFSNPGLTMVGSRGEVQIEDKRVARLLLVLQEIDESVAGLEVLPKAELSELVSKAIVSCGFVEPAEARYAIAAVLEAINIHVPMPESP